MVARALRKRVKLEVPSREIGGGAETSAVPCVRDGRRKTRVSSSATVGSGESSGVENGAGRGAQAAVARVTLFAKPETASLIPLMPAQLPKPAKNEQIKAELPAKSQPIGPDPTTADQTPPNIFPKLEIEDIELAPALAPKNWAKIFNLVVEMRAKFMSPVDTMGCERIPAGLRPHGFDLDETFRFQLLISLMLLSQTKDEVNFAAMKTLDDELTRRGYVKGLCLAAVLDTEEEDINKCIQKVGFHHRKAGYIKRACELLRDNFDGDIPKTIEDIVTLPGVGPKMGYLLLQRGWRINGGIGVDVHIHRLARMWGWTSAKAKTPEATRLELQSWLPRHLWSDINPILVGFGQVVCPPNYGNCDICTLGRQKLCKGANKKLVDSPLTEQRMARLGRQRASVEQLIADRLQW